MPIESDNESLISAKVYDSELFNENIEIVIVIGMKFVDRQGFTRVNVFLTVFVELTPEFLESVILPITSIVNTDPVEKIVRSE